jgi:glycosyltransferase involved in cell wall biosynthesis
MRQALHEKFRSAEVPVVAVIAYSPAPYRVELFDEITRRGRVRLQALYLHRHEPGRQWEAIALQHEAVFLQEQTVPEVSADLMVISYYADPDAGAIWRARRGSGQAWVFWGERPGAHHRGWLGWIARRWRLRYLWKSSATVWAIGSRAAETYREEFGERRRVENLPYFSDLQRFAKSAQTRKTVPGRRRLLFCGSLIARKGVDLLLKAFSQVSARHSGLTLTLAGAGELAATVTQTDSVLLRGFTPWEELPALYSQHDILVVPSRYDGWGMVVPEGLASGMPVLATDQMGAAYDLIRHENNGWIASAGSLEGLVQCLELAAMVDDAALVNMSAAAAASVASHQLSNGAEAFERLSLQALSLAESA